MPKFNTLTLPNQVPENQIFDHLITTELYKNKNVNMCGHLIMIEQFDYMKFKTSRQDNRVQQSHDFLSIVITLYTLVWLIIVCLNRMSLQHTNIIQI